MDYAPYIENLYNELAAMGRTHEKDIDALQSQIDALRQHEQHEQDRLAKKLEKLKKKENGKRAKNIAVCLCKDPNCTKWLDGDYR